MDGPRADSAIGFGVSALAVWRVTHLLAEEDGPAGVVAAARSRLGSGLLGQLADCFGCLSVWVAAPAAVRGAHSRADFLVRWWALSGAAFLLERATARADLPTLVLPDPSLSQEPLLDEIGADDGLL